MSIKKKTLKNTKCRFWAKFSSFIWFPISKLHIRGEVRNDQVFPKSRTI